MCINTLYIFLQIYLDEHHKYIFALFDPMHFLEIYKSTLSSVTYNFIS